MMTGEINAQHVEQAQAGGTLFLPLVGGEIAELRGRGTKVLLRLLDNEERLAVRVNDGEGEATPKPPVVTPMGG